MISRSDFKASGSSSPGNVGGPVASDVRRNLEPRLDEMVDLLGELVSIESASDDPGGLVAMADYLEQLFAPFGSIARYSIGPGGTSHLVVSVAGTGAQERNLAHAVVLGHFDTVWPRGTLERLPFRVDNDGVARGPGCFDMKGGLVLLYFALAELTTSGRGPRRPLRILLNCDEEVRSRTSRKLISTVGAGAAAAFVLEGPLANGALKTARKGAAIYRLVVEGRAAHAGIEPEKGVSAIVELAHHVHALHDLNDPDVGTSVNVGVVRGGTRPNVVAAGAEAEIDVRTSTAAEAERVEQAIGALAPVLDGARLSVVPDLSRPPMERTAASGALFDAARAIAAAMGVDLAEGATGGASDGNLIAARGVPTLDGLGPEGGGAHADHEHVVVESLPRRAALLAGLLAEV